MAWWGFIATTLLCTLVFLVPGYILARSLKAPLTIAVGLAAPITLGVVAGAAIVYAWLGIPFTPSTIVTLLAILAALSAHTTRRYPRAEHPSWRVLAPTLTGVGFGALLIAFQLRLVLLSPFSVHRGGDILFHGYAVQWIAQHHHGSSLDIQEAVRMTGPYPAAWHDLVGIIAMTARLHNVIPLINASLAAAVCLLWPLGTVLLVRQLRPGHPWASSIAGGMASALIPSFPQGLFGHGPLYPFVTALCLAPGVIAAVHVLLTGDFPRSQRWRGALLTAVAALGVALTHPSVIFSMLVLLLPLLITLSLTRRSWPIAALAALTTAATIPAWLYVRPSADWAYGGLTREFTLTKAITALLFLRRSALAPSIILALLLVLGFYAAHRSRERWLMAGWAAYCGLWLSCICLLRSPLRNFLVATWYADPPRLLAQLALASTPLVGLGIGQLLHPLSARFLTQPWHKATACVIALALIMAGNTQLSAASRPGVQYAMNNFPGDTHVLSLEQRQLLERVHERVEPGVSVASIPWNGGSLVYALSGTPTTSAHFLHVTTPSYQDHLVFSLHNLDAETCQILREHNIGYAVDLGPRRAFASPGDAPGFADLGSYPGFELVGHNGPDAKLYRITGCR